MIAIKKTINNGNKCTVVFPISNESIIKTSPYVTCRVAAEGFSRNHRIVAEVFHRFRGHSAKTIISIAYSGRICKYFFFDDSRQIIIRVLKSADDDVADRSFYGRNNSLHIVVYGGRHASVGFGNAYDTVIYVIRIDRDTVCPVGDGHQIVVGIIGISNRRIVGIDQAGKVVLQLQVYYKS